MYKDEGILVYFVSNLILKKANATLGYSKVSVIVPIYAKCYGYHILRESMTNWRPCWGKQPRQGGALSSVLWEKAEINTDI